ncbi:MAG: flavin reductase family protein [Aquificaceae bacterium]|nr:MAG: flavin reductase family protein [Aquificaceae bacterium]
METVITAQTEDKKLIAQLMFSLIVPRPIAWVTTVSKNGVVNLAPFSFYNGITSKPPLIMVSVGKRKDGTPKDTARNIRETGQFVVNLVTEEFLKPMVESGKDFPPEESEVEVLNLQTEPSLVVKPPRIKGVKASLECTVYKIIEIGDTPMDLVIGKVEVFHFDKKLLESSRGVVGRLGGKRYFVVGEEIIPEGV